MTEPTGSRNRRRVGLLVCLLSIALMFGSCVPVGTAIYREVTKSSLVSFDLEPGQIFDSGMIELGSAERLAVSLTVEFHTNSVQESEDDFGDISYEARFQFPVDYEIRAGGEKLFGGHELLAWGPGASVSDEHLDVNGGTASVDTSLKVFKAPPGGQMDLTVQVSGDDKYGAEATGIRLDVFADPPDWLLAGGMGIGMFVLGLPMLVVGLVLAFAGARVLPEHAPAGEVGVAARQMACACHLSGLAGYAVPLGSLIAPLVIWLMQRQVDPFIDDQGREAVNFQISILIYSLVSLVLMLLLIGFVLIFVVIVLHIVLMIVAALRAYNGEPYRYPLTIRFIR